MTTALTAAREKLTPSISLVGVVYLYMQVKIHFLDDNDVYKFSYIHYKKDDFSQLSIWNFVNSKTLADFYTNKESSIIFREMQKIDNSLFNIINNESILTKNIFERQKNNFLNIFQKLQNSKVTELDFFFEKLVHLFGINNRDSITIKVFVIPFIKETGGKEYPSSYRGENIEESVIIFPFPLDVQMNENLLLKLLFHEIAHIFDYYSTESTQSTILYQLTHDVIEVAREQIPLAKNLRDIEIQKILLESVVNAVSHQRYGLFSETVLNEASEDEAYLNTLVNTKKFNTKGDIQMISGWMLLPEIRTYLDLRKSIDEKLFHQVIVNIKKLTS